MHLAAAGPHLFGYQTANLAFITSGVALLIAALSVFYTRKSYRRSGARITLKVRTGYQADHPLQQDLAIYAENEGTAPVRVTGVYFQFKRIKGVRVGPTMRYGATKFFGRRAWIRPVGEGWDKPAKIKGFDYHAWTVARVGLLESDDINARVKVRAVATLAGVGRVKSKWVGLNVTPSVVVQDDKGHEFAIPLSSINQAPPGWEPGGGEDAPAEVRERVEAGEKSGTVEIVGEDGDTEQAHFVVAPPGWKPGDPLPPEVIEQLHPNQGEEQDDST